MATAVIIEDQEEVSAKLSAELESEGFDSVMCFQTTKAASHYLLASNPVDLIFLSLEVEQNSGMNLFKQAPLDAEIIMLSKPNEFLKAAYEEFDASHIFLSENSNQSLLPLIKPSSKKTNKSGLARRLISHFDPHNQWFLAQKSNQFTTAKLEDISYFQRMDNDSVIRTFEGTAFTLKKSFNTLKHDFSESDFFVPHPDYLIRKDRYKVERFNGKSFLMLKMPAVRIPLLNNPKILNSDQSIYINQSKQ